MVSGIRGHITHGFAHDRAPVTILAPAGRDGEVAAMVLERAGLSPVVCENMSALCDAVQNEVGVILITEEALRGAAGVSLLDVIDAQPSWSDIPVVVLTAEGELSRSLSSTLESVIARANVTLLERPVRVPTLVTALRSSLRARRRQFDVRDHLAERTAAEIALRTAQAEAESANRSKSEFLRNMSHELRTPLNAIGGYADLMEMGIRGPVSEAQRDDLLRIKRSQRHLLGLVNEVLNYAKLETGSVHYDMGDVVVAAALTEAQSFVAPQASAKGLTLHPVDCPDVVVARADPEKLRQALVNLLSNAVKFTDSGGAVYLGCRAVGDEVMIFVRDTGMGIATDKLDAVFEPFVQVDQRLTRPFEGTGLGLAISRDLARGMGGDLTAESTVGVGSMFTLTLPKSEARRLRAVRRA